MIAQKVLFRFDPDANESLPDLCNTLLQQQRSSWTQLSGGYEALKGVLLREIQCHGYSVYVQFNPQRKTSTAAKVDPASIRERTCFLCVANLPSEQRGIAYGEEFLVLCNPNPIVDKHLTITHVQHIPQSIELFIPAFLEIARSLSPCFTLLYNGPQCGASAPDHLHFQACPVDSLTMEREMLKPERRKLRKTLGGATVSSLRGIGRQVVLIEGASGAGVTLVFARLISAMRNFFDTDEEPMLNAICSYGDGIWRVLIIPRRKHRPDVFFKEGEGQMMISPAVVDIAGMIITPIERDFHRVDAETIQSIFDEVLLDSETLTELVAAL